MDKKFIIIIAILFSVTIQAQRPQKIFGYGYDWQHGMFDSLLGMPKDTFFVPFTLFPDGSSMRDVPWTTRKGDSLYLWSVNNYRWDLFSGGGGGGAAVSLNNLSSVAINTSLLPNVTGTINLGSSSFKWQNLFINNTIGIGAETLTASDVGNLHSLTNLTIKDNGNDRGFLSSMSYLDFFGAGVSVSVGGAGRTITIPGGANNWTKTSNFIYNNNSGNVAIGSSADNGSKLRVEGLITYNRGSDLKGHMYYRGVDGTIDVIAPAAHAGMRLTSNADSTYTWRDTVATATNNYIRQTFTVGINDGAPVANDSLWKSPVSLLNKLVKLYIGGILQKDSVTSGTGYEYKLDGSSDTIKIHPAFVGGEQITVEILPRSDWTFVGFPGFDPDAQTYFTAAGITNGSTKSAINAFVVSLKGYGIWSGYDYIHILTNGSEALTKLNLVNPVDADANYRLTFVNSATWSSTGVTTNGSTQYINTHLILSSATHMATNDYHVAVYNRTSSGIAGFTLGVSDGTAPLYMLCRSTDDLSYTRQINTTEQNYSDATSGKGFYIMNSRPSVAPVARTDKDNVHKLSSAYSFANSLPGTYSLIYNAYNNTGTISQYRAGELSIISAGRSFTDTELANYQTAIATLVAALGL